MLKGCYIQRNGAQRHFINNMLEIIEEVVPSSKAIDIWDFPDYPNCGEDIQDGEFVLSVTIPPKT